MYFLALWGGQSWPQPPFRRRNRLESRFAGKIACPPSMPHGASAFIGRIALVMSDRLSLSLWLRGAVTPQSQFRALEKILRAFPFSKLTQAASTLTIMAVDWSEPAVAEYPLEAGTVDP